LCLPLDSSSLRPSWLFLRVLPDWGSFLTFWLIPRAASLLYIPEASRCSNYLCLPWAGSPFFSLSYIVGLAFLRVSFASSTRRWDTPVRVRGLLVVPRLSAGTSALCPPPLRRPALGVVALRRVFSLRLPRVLGRLLYRVPLLRVLTPTSPRPSSSNGPHSGWGPPSLTLGHFPSNHGYRLVGSPCVALPT
jgi:hypothetical protein